MNFQKIKNKWFFDSTSKIAIGNAEEIRFLIVTVEDQAETIEMYKKELLQAKDRIKELERNKPVIKKARYMDLDD